MPYTPFFISEPQPTPSDLNAFEIYGNLSGVRVRPMEKTNGAPALLDTADFYRVLATHGISYYDGGGGVAFYGRAGNRVRRISARSSSYKSRASACLMW
jgi:hypothetical protein